MISEDRYSGNSQSGLLSSLSRTSIASEEKTFYARVMKVMRSHEFLPLTCALLALIFSRTVDQTLYYRLNFSYSYYIW